MIDPEKITNFNRTQDELEELWIFCICVAGKNAHRMAKAVDALIQEAKNGIDVTPLDGIFHLIQDSRLEEVLRKVGTGQYTRIKRALEETVDMVYFKGNHPAVATQEELEAIHGVGPKTSRFFILHSRADQYVAALDTHILKFLKERGYDVPESTPEGEHYERLQRAFLEEAEAAGKSPAELDLEVWIRESRKAAGKPPPEETPTSSAERILSGIDVVTHSGPPKKSADELLEDIVGRHTAQSRLRKPERRKNPLRK